MGKVSKALFPPFCISFQNGKLLFFQRVVLDNPSLFFSFSISTPADRTVRQISGIIALAAALVFSPVESDAFDWFWQDSLTAAGSCGTAIDGTLSSGTSCLLDGGVNLLLKKSMDSADEYGKKAFGEKFQFFGDLSYQSGTGFVNDLDVVIPLAFTDKNQWTRSSLFLQQGITRWRDSEGDSRDDFRFGVAYRFRLKDETDADVVGMSAFSLHSADWGHQVLASRLDYAGRWGTGSLTYFLPATELASHGTRIRGARPGRLSGVRSELKLTTTVRAN